MTTSKPAAPVARDADAELEALFAAIDDVILVLDAEGRYVKIAPTNPSLLYRPAAERLRASEQRFRALVEHSSDVITLLAPDGTVIYASPSTQPVLGYGATENV